MWQILGTGGLFGSPHPWAFPKMPIPNSVNYVIKRDGFLAEQIIKNGIESLLLRYKHEQEEAILSD